MKGMSWSVHPISLRRAMTCEDYSFTITKDVTRIAFLHFMLYLCLFKLNRNITSVLACYYKENEKCFASSARAHMPKVSWYSIHIFGMFLDMRGLSLVGHRAGGQKTGICIDRVRVTLQTSSETETTVETLRILEMLRTGDIYQRKMQ